MLGNALPEMGIGPIQHLGEPDSILSTCLSTELILDPKPKAPAANTINVFQAFIYKYVKSGLFLK